MHALISEAATLQLRSKLLSRVIFSSLLILWIAPLAEASPRKRYEPQNSLLVQVDAPESDVMQAVQEVSEDQIIHGTFSYEKERTLYGAHAESSAPVFGPWEGLGKPIFKTASKILAPKFFKDSGDIGTIFVRYVVQSAEPNTTSLRIDAVFVDASMRNHPSTGSVESAEYAAIQEHLKAIQQQRDANQKAAQEIADRRAQGASPSKTSVSTPAELDDSWSLGLTVPQLEQRVADLRREVELQVKLSGASVKAAPYRGANTLVSLPAKASVVIVVLTPYWYGVETEDGHHGWIHRSELEPLD